MAIIYKLPNNVSKEKVGILKFFIVSCFIFIILSTGTGIANALFNKEKIDEKDKTIANVTTKYETERNNWLKYKADVTNEFNKIESQLNRPVVNKDLIRSNLKNLNTRTMEMQFSKIEKK